ncbi:hypothetical protein HO173_006437 [Letharia columbiana]|uniref:Uncharacterized protein n=1 Tax=Letharia columbiana TaxID=112416 RepID=A0A8H6FV31_9LECA|nr:uncharacterized protein HO173_006437 [Letharia columbiana]KAF6235243.1 hypothetical protein HO173_006437 [Letharia columbiana]
MAALNGGGALGLLPPAPIPITTDSSPMSTISMGDSANTAPAKLRLNGNGIGIQYCSPQDLPKA